MVTYDLTTMFKQILAKLGIDICLTILDKHKAVHFATVFSVHAHRNNSIAVLMTLLLNQAHPAV